MFIGIGMPIGGVQGVSGLPVVTFSPTSGGVSVSGLPWISDPQVAPTTGGVSVDDVASFSDVRIN